MLNDPNPITTITTTNNDQLHRITETENNEGTNLFRDIHALVVPSPPSPPPQTRRREVWETGSSSSTASSENFTSMSREFNALVLAGATVENSTENHELVLARIGEDEHEDHGPPEGDVFPEEQSRRDTNPLAMVADSSGRALGNVGAGTVERVKREEVDAKISAWQNAKVAKINNRFKREDAVIAGFENEEVNKATSWMKKVERKLEEKRARALEKMQNDVAKARRKAEERRASAEAKRGTKVARVLEIANLMRAVGRPPAKRSFF